MKKSKITLALIAVVSLITLSSCGSSAPCGLAQLDKNSDCSVTIKHIEVADNSTLKPIIE